MIFTTHDIKYLMTLCELLIQHSNLSLTDFTCQYLHILYPYFLLNSFLIRNVKVVNYTVINYEMYGFSR